MYNNKLCRYILGIQNLTSISKGTVNSVSRGYLNFWFEERKIHIKRHVVVSEPQAVVSLTYMWGHLFLFLFLELILGLDVIFNFIYGFMSFP